MRTRSRVRIPFLKMRLSKFVALSSLSRPYAFAGIDVNGVTLQRFDLCRWWVGKDPARWIGFAIGMFQADHPPDLTGRRCHDRMGLPGPDRHLRVGEEVLHLDTKPTGEPISRTAGPHDEVRAGWSRRSEGTGAV